MLIQKYKSAQKSAKLCKICVSSVLSFFTHSLDIQLAREALRSNLTLGKVAGDPALTLAAAVATADTISPSSALVDSGTIMIT